MFQFKKNLSALVLLLLALFGGHAQASLVIMPLGDSITQGGGAGDPSNQSGYRDQLFTDLNNENVSFSFTGTSSDYASAQLTAAGDQYHNGKSGYTLGNIDSNLTVSNGTPEIFGVASNPNVVLLLGGTNDIQFNESVATTESNMTNVLTWFKTNLPNTILLVGEVIPYDVTSNSNMATYNTEIKQFNSWLATAVPSYGSNFHLVDTYDPFISPGGAINSSLYIDGLHPTADAVAAPGAPSGYADIGNPFNAAIESDVVTAAVATPEPSALSLLAAGFLLLALACYRSKSVGTIYRGSAITNRLLEWLLLRL